MNVDELRRQPIQFMRQLTKALNDNQILEQKYKLSEMKIKEFEERNQSINRMNGTILNVLNELNVPQSGKMSELQRSLEQYQVKNSQHVENIKQLETANKLLQQQVHEGHSSRNELQQRQTVLQDQNACLLKTVGAKEQMIQILEKSIQDLQQQKIQMQTQVEDLQFTIQKHKFESDCRIEELLDENQSLKSELKYIMASMLRKTQLNSFQASPEKQNETKVSESKSVPKFLKRPSKGKWK